MLFHVHMKVKIPATANTDSVEELKKKEKEYSQTLQRQGKWKHIWRITGQYENISIFEVQTPDELHEIIMKLPLLPYLEFEVKSLCHHSSSIIEKE